MADPDSTAIDSSGRPHISVVVPTINEGQNLPELLRRIAAALAAHTYEVLIIDDASTDDTPAVCERLAERHPISLHVRTNSRGGLSGAVLFGMSLAKGDVLVVMDADLQHPPECIPELIAPLNADSPADFVLGSRYIAGGSTAEKWSPAPASQFIHRHAPRPAIRWPDPRPDERVLRVATQRAHVAAQK